MILWEVVANAELARFQAQTASITRVRFSSDGKLLATASDDGTVVLWRLSR